MSYSDDTASHMFYNEHDPRLANYYTHVHDYTFWKVDEQGWWFACDCQATILRSDKWMEAQGKKVGPKQ